ncbi:MAG: potassium transporter TrkA, partial [Euryarchaeota archaeon]|nr:potassium transporter TrkA [Euryarchaeota archaeon]
ELDIPISKELATALLYGIRTDTHEFKIETDPADLTAAAFLYPLADHDMLGKVEMPSMSTETLDILGEAIQSRRIKGSYLISNVGSIRDRDALPQAADYLLNLEGISTVIVFGLGDEHIYISGRSKDIRLNIGNAMNEAFGDIGSAGGHSTAAAAQIPLGVFSGVKDKQTIMRLAEEAVMKRFLAAVGEKEKE